MRVRMHPIATPDPSPRSAPGPGLRDLLVGDLHSAGAHPGGRAGDAADDVVARLDEPHRRYHDGQHVREVRAALQTLGQASSATLLAAWLHDVVYDPRAAPGANERASARYAHSRLNELGADAAVVAEVVAMVGATAGHDAAAAVLPSPDGGAADARARLLALLDADLWILSAPRQRFDDYCAGVRAEYGFVDDDTYAAARSRILADLMNREPLYALPGARSWAERARGNVAAELTRLSST